MSTNSSFSQNIGNNNLSIPANGTRQLKLFHDANFQVLDEGTNALLSLVSGNGAFQGAALAAYIPEADGNTASVQINAQTAEVQIVMAADFNDGVNQPKIVLHGSATLNNIEHTATHHNFNLVEYATNAAALLGGLTAGDLYHTAGIVKIVI